MPDLYRGTFIMTGRGQGWSESYIFPRDQVTVAQVNQTILQPCALARARLLATEYTLQAFRATKIRLDNGTPVKRNSDLVIVNYEINKGVTGWEGCQPNECVIANGVTNDGSREKKVFMRGIPDVVITNGGTLNRNENLGWFSRLDSFFALLLLNQAGWIGDVADGGQTNVTGYTIEDSFQILITVQDNFFAAIPVGTRVRVRLNGINTKSELNGIRWVSVVSANSVRTVEAFSLWPYSHGGQLQALLTPKPFFSAGGWGAELARTHQTGKVSVGTRGRQSARPKG